MTSTEGTAEGASPTPVSGGHVVVMVAALLVAVMSFQLNATMLSPAIHDIETELGDGAFAAMSTYFYLAGARLPCATESST